MTLGVLHLTKGGRPFLSKVKAINKVVTILSVEWNGTESLNTLRNSESRRRRRRRHLNPFPACLPARVMESA